MSFVEPLLESEARQALARARELAPDHPRIAELARALGDDRDESES
jgi:hypothetical protein